MYRWVDSEQTVITRLADGVQIQATPGARFFDEVQDWVSLGNQVAPYVPPPLNQDDYAAAIQAHIDATAKSKGYADGVALASYITSTIPSWQGEAAVFVPWRDSVWLAAYTTLGAVQGGVAPPTVEQLIASLPPITWPT